ncbi:ABC transporter substrate-binding protein, partial [Streptomyces sp. JV178]|uniref:ABC transporter substrate-binding protein n=1 Tax=Streptomyces sp. JV178 TaxID=858632 RepID=UPI000C5AA39A
VTLTAKKSGDRQVRVTTEDPDPALPLRLSSPGLAILSAKAYAGKRVNPVGAATGPFELTEVTGTTAATLDRYDDYWGGRAQAPGIDARFIADGTARTNALRARQADVAEAVPDSPASTSTRGTRHETATTRTTSLLLNTDNG